MSAVTKTFIVLLVILSLVLSAGLVVFVNRTENFKVSMAAKDAQILRNTALLDTETNHVAALNKDVAMAYNQRDTQAATDRKQIDDLNGKIAELNASVSEVQGQLKIAQVGVDSTVAALNASEAARKALTDLLETTRTDNNTLNKKSSELNLAINDLTAQLAQAKRMVSDYQETIAAQKARIAEIERAPPPGHTDVASLPPTSPPPINGVVRRTQMIGGIEYATISVGSNDQVVKGMKFIAVGPSGFLGEITVETVDEKEATGKMEGPKVSEIKVNTEVKTQL